VVLKVGTVPEMRPARYTLCFSALTPVLLSALMVLSGCESFPPASFPGQSRESRPGSGGPGSTSGAVGPSATGTGTAASVAASAQAAAALEVRARKGAVSERAPLQLQAARAWLHAGRPFEATRVLGAITAPLTPAQDIEKQVLEADLLAERGQTQQAWQKMSGIPEPAGTPFETQYLSSRMRIALGAGRPVEGVRSEMTAERFASTNQERSALRSDLLAQLRQARERGVKLEAEASQDVTVRGWLELGAMASDAAGTSAAAGTSISAAAQAAHWRTSYPAHPASELLASALPAPIALSGKMHKIALLLPVTGQASGYAALIHSGFDYAYQQLPADSRPQVQVFDTGAMPVAEALNQARSEGSDFIVGPLTRTEVDVAAATNITVPTLALNYLSVGRNAPNGLFQFGLSPEEEARLVAQRLLAAGLKRGATLAPTGDWGTRVMAAFTQELLAGGGTILAQGVYDSNGHDFGAPIRTILATDQSYARRQRLELILGVKLEFEPRSRNDLEFIFAPGQATNLRLLRPQLRFQYAGNVPVYATSDAYAVDGGVANQDLDGLIMPTMPWLVPGSGEADTIRQAAQEAGGANVAWQSGLYAFGYDALQMSLALAATGRNHAGLRIAGLTGQLTVDADGRVHREPVWARITRQGEPQIVSGD